MRPIPSLPMNESAAMLEICSCSDPSISALGFGSSLIFLKMADMSLPMASGSSPAIRLMAEVYTIGKSVCSSDAPSSQKRSKVLSITYAGLAAGLSILLTTTRTVSPSASAFLRTNRVCGFGPSAASTRRSTPSTMLSTRSTSPPKSACPGVSTMFTLIPSYSSAAFFAKIVMPRSRSWSLLSITRSSLPMRLELNVLADSSIASTSVVLPWSTCATIAMLRMSSRTSAATIVACMRIEAAARSGAADETRWLPIV
mmetsp:Transcript_17598/g.30788  ORF Transcript_17598/g.30788 Transcript_17598/m.30788 type:complete len:256 (+) Transcript_17598:682-1449(+)